MNKEIDKLLAFIIIFSALFFIGAGLFFVYEDYLKISQLETKQAYLIEREKAWQGCRESTQTTELIAKRSAEGMELLKKELVREVEARIFKPYQLRFSSDGQLFFGKENLSKASGQIYVDGDWNLSHLKAMILPKNLYVNGIFIVKKDYPIFSLPNVLIVKESFAIVGAPQQLPSKLIVGDNFSARDGLSAGLPNTLVVGKNLDLTNATITSLPEQIFVGSNINLTKTTISKLPVNLFVSGDLNLTEASIIELPCGLRVGGTLIVSGTRIESLPYDLFVGVLVDLRNTQFSQRLKEFPYLIDQINRRSDFKFFY